MVFKALLKNQFCHMNIRKTIRKSCVIKLFMLTTQLTKINWMIIQIIIEEKL